MRTTAKAQGSRAAGAVATVANRRGRPVGKAEPALSGPQPSFPEASSVAVTTVRMLRVDEGLHVLRIGEIAGELDEIAGMVVPMAQVSAPFAEDGKGVEIVASFPQRGPWLEKEGGAVILRSPTGGGLVIVTVYGGSEQEASELALDLERLDDPGNGVAAAGPTDVQPMGEPAPAAIETRDVPIETSDVPIEILLHIERVGDRLFPGRGWVGALGRRMRIEAFSIRPLERLAPADIEMKGFLPNGAETPWVPGGVLCGTRGRGLPLTGFAVRVVAQRAERFEVAYQGSFFAGGISQMHQNGAPCQATTADDPLEAINVRLIEYLVDPEEIATAG